MRFINILVGAALIAVTSTGAVAQSAYPDQVANLPPTLSPICGNWVGNSAIQNAPGDGRYNITINCATMSGSATIWSHKRQQDVTPGLRNLNINGNEVTYSVDTGLAVAETTLYYSSYGGRDRLEGTAQINHGGRMFVGSIVMERGTQTQ